jgi:hypothetical protein
MQVMVSHSTSTSKQIFPMSGLLRHTTELRECTTLERSMLRAIWGRAVQLTVMLAIWRIDSQGGMTLNMDVALMTTRNSKMNVQYQNEGGMNLQKQSERRFGYHSIYNRSRSRQ